MKLTRDSLHLPLKLVQSNLNLFGRLLPQFLPISGDLGAGGYFLLAIC